MPTPWHQEDQSSPDGGPDRRVGLPRQRWRSFCFVERAGERWTVFLVTYLGEDGHWRGHFAFRPATGEPEESEIRTADLFVEEGEAQVDTRARGLGRPLLVALLESALHTEEKRQGYSPDARRTIRETLAQRSAAIAPDPNNGAETLTLAHLRSMYDSYRIDQVCHLISLTRPDHFRGFVERLLDGREIDFRSRDRLQLSMLVVQELEKYLPLPPFEVWVEDYLAHQEEYHRYSHLLHREGQLF